MPPDPTQLVRRFYEALNERDADTLDAMLTADGQLHTHVGSVTGRVYSRGELRPYMADVAEVWDEVTQTLKDVTVLQDGRVLASVRFHARAKGSGVETDQTLGVLFEVGDGGLASMRAYASPADALAAAGTYT
jgi:ketosteroid isomerase-like protein